MNRWFGVIGYVVPTDKGNGVWVDEIVEREYYGDIVRNRSLVSSADKVNYDVNVSNVISVFSDPYVIENFHAIRYVEFMGSKWKVQSVEVKYPRLELSLGGLYNV